MLWWGDHLFYDAFTDTLVFPLKDEHQINMSYIDPMTLWDQMWRLRQMTTAREINEIWRMHIFDDVTGKWDRHARDEEHWAVGFTLSGASFIRAFSFMHDKTGDAVWKSRAELLRDHVWSHRNTTTNIIPDVANTCYERGEDYYLRLYTYCSTPGTWVPMLVYCYKTFDDTEWLDQAEAISQGWLTYAYDPAAEAFYKFIRIDGVYAPDYPDVESDYSSFWRDKSNFRNSSSIGLGLLDAYEISRKSFLLDGAKLIGDKLLTSEPRSDSSSGGYHGSYGEYYAAAINIMMRLHRITNDQRYLDRAIFMANHAIAWLWNDTTKIFRGHYYHGYEIGDGTDKLCEVLVDLDSYIERNLIIECNDDFREDSLLIGKWKEQYDERTSCWIDTLSSGKLVIRDENAGGKMSIRRSFPKAASDQYLRIQFSLNATRMSDEPIVIEINDDSGINALKISAGLVDGNYQWIMNNGQINPTGQQCVTGQAYTFELAIRGQKANIEINGQSVLDQLSINNNLLSHNLSEIKLQTGITSTANIEFDWIKVDYSAEAPNADAKMLWKLAKDWLVKCGNVNPQMPQLSPQIWYKFDETSGLTAVDTQEFANGTLYNFPLDNIQWIDGQYAGALSFDGINDWVDIADIAMSDFHNKTICMWIKADSVPTTGFILGTRTNYRIYIHINPNMTLDAQLTNMPIFGTAGITAGEWTHIALVLKDTVDGFEAAEFYVNGELKGSASGFARHSGSLIGANLGSYGGGLNSFAQVVIDDFRIYNAPLSEANIVWLASSPADLNKSGNVNMIDLAILGQNWAGDI
ncbi:MAG TPA: hypothetical protein DDX75_00050 [Phycisphaerales bacterium]|nr:hypothetical protein [Phycisphaerales bacterium]